MELYSVKDVARILKISYATALKKIREGKIKATCGGDGSKGKRGCAYVIRQDDLDEYRKKHDLIPDDILEHAPAPKITIVPQTQPALYDKEAVMKRIMMKSNWNYSAIARSMNSHSTTILSIMNGKLRCSVEFIYKFADIFKLDRTKLYEAIKKGVDIEELEKQESEPEVQPEPVKEEEPTIDISTVKHLNDKMLEKLKKSGVEFAQKTVADAQKYYYVITCYVRTKEGVIFDNLGFQRGCTNLATPKIFKTKEDAEAYIRNVIHGVCDTKNNSGCYYKIHVDERQLIVYKTIYDICRMEMSE